MLWLAILAACGNDIGITDSAKCDGRLQAGEDTVDSPFDADGDGYFDANNPDCHRVYLDDRLDCDDLHAEANPGGFEEECNGIDDDCDPGTPDLNDVGCVETFDGTWDLDQRVTYSCALGNVNVDFQSVLVQDDAPSVTITAIGGGTQPATMTGQLNGTVFQAQRVISGGCTETYSFVGQFTGGEDLSATFTASYAGGALACLDCATKTWTVAGYRQ